MDDSSGSYQVSGGWRIFLDALQEAHPCALREFRDRRTAFLDTFDWRLFERRHTLVFERASDGSRLELAALSGEVICRLASSSAPDFPSDLPICPMRDRLEKLCSVRRLLSAVELQSSGIEVSLLDREGKTVGRVIALESTASSPREGGRTGVLPARVGVVPVRGYPDIVRRVHGLLNALPGVAPLEGSELDLAMQAVGRFPGDYSSRLEVALYPEMPVHEALRTVLRTLLGALRANQEGMIRNLDPEFLHDFRVAIRRTRSLLGQVRDVLPVEPTVRLREELRWLGNETGRLRDLDVYLLRLGKAGAGLPTDIRRDLAPLVEYLRIRHAEEHARLVRLIRSERYKRLLSEWDGSIESTDGRSPSSEQSVLDRASERIWTTYRRIVKLGSRVEGDSAPEAFHKVRLECKKFRYLLEFSQTLYEPGFVQHQVRVLKGLQDVLGEYNDLQIQRDRLGEFAEGMASRGDVPAATLLSMGRLAERLAAEQVRVRRRFRRRFGPFADRANRGELLSRLKPRRRGKKGEQ